MSHTRNTINLAAALTSIAVLGFAMGFVYPLLSLALANEGLSPASIGLNAAAQPAGTIAALVATPKLVQTFGAKAVALACALSTAVLVAAYPWMPGFLPWTLLRFCQGLSFSVLFAISEAWVVQCASGPYRSRILSLYMSIFALSMALGPVLIAVVGSLGTLPFSIGAAVLAVAIIPILLVHEVKSTEEAVATSFGQFVWRIPMLLIAVALFAMTEISCLSLLPVFGILKGMNEMTAALLVTGFVSGPVLLQYPIGWLADTYSKSKVLVLCSGMAAIAFGLMPFMILSWAVWPLLLMAGALTSGLYTVSLAMLGEQYSGAELIRGTAAFSAVYGVGSLGGSAVSGEVMTIFGPEAFIFLLALVCGLFCAATGKLNRIEIARDRLV
jgi:MFS family permease